METSRQKFPTDTLTDASKLSLSLVFEQGCTHLEQARLQEGIALLTLVSEHLKPEQLLTEHLRSLIEGCNQQVKLQQQLFDASTHIANIKDQMQKNLASIQNLQLLFLQEASLLTETASEAPAFFTQQQAMPQRDQTFPEEAAPSLYAICLAPFEIRQEGIPLELCTNRNGQAILRYLIAQENHCASVDTLMALLWPDDPDDIALNKLHVSVSLLRRSLQKRGNYGNKYILYKQKVYQLDPEVHLRSDIEEFLEFYHLGRKVKDIAYYERACSLYKRPFMLEDLYSNWSFQQREHLRKIYITMCHALVLYYIDNRLYEQATYWANKILEENRCDEEAHRHLIRIYALLGRRHDALRQYQLCQKVLQEEMSVDPMLDTVSLVQTIMHGDIL